MTDLSPQAQAVINAFDSRWASTRQHALIVALRVLADQLVPMCSSFTDERSKQLEIRGRLLALVHELEANYPASVK